MRNYITNKNTAAVILAGGEGRRLKSLGHSKPMIPLNGRPLIEYTLEIIERQLDQILISGSDPQLEYYAKPLINDQDAQRLGPLAGIYASMRWLQQHQPKTQWLLVCPVDTPKLPAALFSSLAQAMGNQDLALAQCVASGQSKWQPLHSLWSLDLCTKLEQHLQEQQYRVMQFIKQQRFVTVDFNDEFEFSNLNKPADLAKLEQSLTNNIY